MSPSKLLLSLGSFNSRLREEATGASRRVEVLPVRFNSRLREEATAQILEVKRKTKFQLTPP